MTLALVKLLEAVEYPHFESFEINDEIQVRDLVAWLESNCIRSIQDETQRAALGSASSGDSWRDSFSSYCESQKCPFKVTAGSGQEILAPLSWVIEKAVACVFNDTDTSEWGELIDIGPGAGPPRLSDTELPSLSPAEDTTRALRSLAASLGLPETQDTAALARAVYSALSSGFTPAHLSEALDKAKGSGKDSSTGKDGGNEGQGGGNGGHGGGNGGQGGTAMGPESHPLGLVTGDEALDEAGRVLRVLHVAGLRGVQTVFNDVLAECQEFTANPKTDHSLGKVGH